MLNISKSPAVSLQHRHLGAIAALILISLFSSSSGLSLHHVISNGWDGLLWGIADPVLSLVSLASIVAIGLLSAGVVQGLLITAVFLLSAILGILLHLSQINLPGAEMTVSLASIACGAILIMPHQLHWLIIAMVGAITGCSQGYVNTQSLIGVEIIPILTYILGTVLTLYAVAMSAKEITIKNALPQVNCWLGWAVCGIGIVFFSNFIN